MGTNSKIEWCDHTFNPWMGCTKVSAGCKNCYAEQLMDKRWSKVQWGPQGTRVRTSADNWAEPLKWNRQAKAQGIRYRVFCASLADVFERKENQPELEVWRAQLFALMIDTPNLAWLVLTKRPENFMSMISSAGEWWFQNGSPLKYGKKLLQWWNHGESFALPNVWIGTSVENQAQADSRIPALLRIPAKVRFLSMEPLLGPVQIDEYYQEEGGGVYSLLIDYLDWVIVGGESGPHARPMHPDWARSVRDPCVAAGVPFFFKQWGEYAPVCDDTPMPLSAATVNDKLVLMYPDGRVLESGDFITPNTVAMWRAGKNRAGRLLDGREWNEMPGMN